MSSSEGSDELERGRREAAAFKAAPTGAERTQRVYRRSELVAVVVDPATFDRLQDQVEPATVTLEHAAARVREVLAEEGYELEVPVRRDRDPGFGQDL